MVKQRSFKVAGVDGCKAGWFIVFASVVDNPSKCLTPVLMLDNFFTAQAFSEVLSRTKDCKLICIDIPIGLSDGPEPRRCDIEARKILGRPRASSVFPPPIRQCLTANDYETASKISFKYSGKRLTKQSFFLLEKIRQVNDLMTPALQHRVREIHPEISFWVLNNKQPIQQNKKTIPGQAHRCKLLQKVFADMDSILAQSSPRGYAMDDVLDALAAAWTASLAVLGKTEMLPKNPETDSKGLRMEILCPKPFD